MDATTIRRPLVPKRERERLLNIIEGALAAYMAAPIQETPRTPPARPGRVIEMKRAG